MNMSVFHCYGRDHGNSFGCGCGFSNIHSAVVLLCSTAIVMSMIVAVYVIITSVDAILTVLIAILIAQIQSTMALPPKPWQKFHFSAPSPQSLFWLITCCSLRADISTWPSVDSLVFVIGLAEDAAAAPSGIRKVCVASCIDGAATASKIVGPPWSTMGVCVSLSSFN